MLSISPPKSLAAKPSRIFVAYGPLYFWTDLEELEKLRVSFFSALQLVFAVHNFVRNLRTFRLSSVAGGLSSCIVRTPFWSSQTGPKTVMDASPAGEYLKTTLR